jgi:hypothetical protein
MKHAHLLAGCQKSNDSKIHPSYAWKLHAAFQGLVNVYVHLSWSLGCHYLMLHAYISTEQYSTAQ